MEWANRMNQAMAYIESHLMEDIDYAEVAKIACCSVYHLQRMFPFLTDVTLSEYVRRRRLTLAAVELQNSDIKVIDLALKYGYESPEAFTRSFQQMHGTAPSSARKAGTMLKAYPPFSFQFSMNGVAEMNYRLETLPAFSVIGANKRVHTANAFATVPGMWAAAAGEGLFEQFWQIWSSDHPLRGILGVCADGDHGKNEEFTYIMSVVSGHLPPDGLSKRDFPAATWAVFEAAGGPEGIAELWKRLYTEWVPASGYALAYLPAIERYLPPEENKNELWVAVVKA
ncbi:AraC family transcriptional regulator [Brevibacillus sp. TJ4]|uniref:AraC family transcriptional regulator n=1 Tax=Brevibacillus sp. TJ4 TaxID=3234853 RepID=UPI0037D7A8F8